MEGELLLVLSLYRQLPFGQMHQRNRSVVHLAEAIGRTPSAVALKLVNFASLDPTLLSRGIKGMGNTSRLDRETWERFATRWDQLATALPDSVAASIAPEIKPDVTEVERIHRARVGQGFFRNAVLSAYDMQCCVTGIAEPSLLRASHIAPWAEFVSERLNPSNGLCLNAMHDAAFDRGLMTIDESLRVVVSGRLRTSCPEDAFVQNFGAVAGRKIRVPDRNQPDVKFLSHHREHIYVG